MKFAIVEFPGSNCDHDAYYAAKHVLGQQAEFIWHKDTDLHGADVVVLPGVGAFGDAMQSLNKLDLVSSLQDVATSAKPLVGICLGMQVAVIEYARNVAGLKDAHSTEFREHTPEPVVGLITEWLDASGEKEERTEESDLGGTMRLGAQDCVVAEGSTIANCYGRKTIRERHRHRFEVNNHFLPQLEGAGLRISGRSTDGKLVEVVEVPDHPWFVACQFHPEFTSTPRDGHPLFKGFVEAALARKKES